MRLNIFMYLYKSLPTLINLDPHNNSIIFIWASYNRSEGFLNGIFSPWVRWITGLALAENSSVAAVVVVALQV